MPVLIIKPGYVIGITTLQLTDVGVKYNDGGTASVYMSDNAMFADIIDTPVSFSNSPLTRTIQMNVLIGINIAVYYYFTHIVV